MESVKENTIEGTKDNEQEEMQDKGINLNEISKDQEDLDSSKL